MNFNDEQLRTAVNLRQFYDAWMGARRELAALDYRLYWKTVNKREYLVKLVNNSNDGTSLGPRSSVTERQKEAYERAKSDARTRFDGAAPNVNTAARLYRTLRLPMIASAAAAILRSADERGMLDGELIVVGTTALAAYELEAGSRFALGLDATEDFDLAWSGGSETLAIARSPAAPIMTMLKAVDSTFTKNTERPFEARNAKAYQVDILVAPSVAPTYPRTEPLQPLPLPEQEWLLGGTKVDQVVCGRDATPARIVAADPRWYALHKLWLGEQPKRNPLKRSKDVRQGEALLAAVADEMPQFPLDDVFASGLPNELDSVFRRWQRRTRSGK